MYDRVLIGVLGNSNLKEYCSLTSKENECVLLFSRLNLSKLDKDTIRSLEKPVLLICSNQTVSDAMRYKYEPDMVSLTNWLLSQGTKALISLRDGSKLYACLNMNIAKYDGNKGYGITTHIDNVDIRYHGYGASINSINDKLLQWVFNGVGITRYVYGD